MPTRTEIVISFGEVLDCLPPGKSYNRRRYNSFDANIGPVEGNEENLAPSIGIRPCKDREMRPDQHGLEEPEVLDSKAKNATKTVNCDETDDEISFRDIKLKGDSPDDGKNKSKRKSNAERFLEDNANYFQLEVLSSKTRSNKLVKDDDQCDSEEEEDGKGGFHNSFFDFLKSKGVEKESTGRSRHKSADSDIGERASSRTAHGRSRSSHSRFGRSRSSARSVNGRDSSLSRERSKSSNLLAAVDASEVFMSESESECSVRLPRLELGKPGSGWSKSPSESSDTSCRGRRGRSLAREVTSESETDNTPATRQTRAKSSGREASPSGSEAEVVIRPRRGKSAVRAGSVTESELETPDSSRRDISPSESEPEVPSTRPRRGKSPVGDVSLSGSEAEVLTTRSRRGKSPAGKSVRAGSATESEAETLPGSSRGKSLSRDLSPSESETEVPTTRSRRGKSPPRDEVASESEVDTAVRTRRSKSTIRELREVSLSESEAETLPRTTRHSRSSVRDVSPSESEAEAPARPRRGGRREVSPSGSEAESVASNTSKYKHSKGGTKESDAESDDDSVKQTRSSGKKGIESPNSKKKKRSELDKLLEAVDTSFHFETAAAERRRLNDSGLGPLEIDCSDTGSEASCNISNKRKFSETEAGGESNKKRVKESNNLLKTASPGSTVKSEEQSGDDFESESSCAWDGWDVLNDQLKMINEDPVEPSKMHFSFETEPVREGWYSTYQRQDRGDELVFYPTSTTAPFILPYELPYSAFLPNKPGKRDTDTSRDQSKASSPVRQLSGPAKKGKRKISECESTDSDDTRRGKSRSSKATSTTSSILVDKLGPKGALLLEANYRVSPRCHASTKSFGVGGGLPGDLDDLAEAYLMQDERELHFPHLAPFLPSEENSNDSFSSCSVNSRVRSESSVEMLQLAASLDSMLQNPGDLPSTPLSPTTPAKVPPTRSRVSSDQLLSPKKAKKKKKVSPNSDQSGMSPLDQLVADNIDPVLLDCLEDELPTIPGPLMDSVVANPMDLLDSYSSCTSMSVCNSRWLRPNKRDSSLPNRKDSRLENKPKKLPSPNKPKRIIIYKDDLPGFSIDSDMEAEKLPVSKRGMAKGQSETKEKAEDKSPSKNAEKKDVKKGDIKKTEKKEGSKKSPIKMETLTKDEEENQSDEDSESVESFSSNSSGSKKRRKTNKTGFPSPKKKKKSLDFEKNNSKLKTSPSNQTKPIKSKSDSSKPSPVKPGTKSEKPKASSEKAKQTLEAKSTPMKKVSKQIKMDRFITKKTVKKTSSTPDKSKSTSSSPVVPLVASRRSAALKAKNYSELESDTESLFESSLILSPSPSPAPASQKKPGKSGSVQVKGVKKR